MGENNSGDQLARTTRPIRETNLKPPSAPRPGEAGSDRDRLSGLWATFGAFIFFLRGHGRYGIVWILWIDTSSFGCKVFILKFSSGRKFLSDTSQAGSRVVEAVGEKTSDGVSVSTDEGNLACEGKVIGIHPLPTEGVKKFLEKILGGNGGVLFVIAFLVSTDFTHWPENNGPIVCPPPPQESWLQPTRRV